MNIRLFIALSGLSQFTVYNMRSNKCLIYQVQYIST